MKKEEKFLEIRDGGFLQSKRWAFFQEEVGNKMIKLQFPAEFSASIVKYTLPIVGTYLFVPRGPIFLKEGVAQKCSKELLQIAKKEKSAWIRLEPQTKKDLDELRNYFKNLGCRVVKSKKNHEPAQTLMLDLKKTEKELLAEMKSKTRYNIRLAGKKGVKIEKSRDDKAIEAFIRLSEETAKRDGIKIHQENYYRRMIEVIPSDILSLYVAKFEGKIIATALVSFSGTVATYLHGASSSENRNVMAPHLLQWTAICQAKERGFSKYDFGGTKIQKNEKGQLIENSWSGISKFKIGFSPKGELTAFPGCWDVIVDKRKYHVYKFLQNIQDEFRKLKIKIKKNAKIG